MKVVIAHDYLNQRGGAERVVATLHELYPEAPIYTLFVDHDTLWPALQSANIVPSALQRVPLVMKHFKLFFWLYPFMVRNLVIPDCDVLITSSSAYAKGVKIRAKSGHRPTHICYCHTPMRFAWDYERYIAKETGHPLLRIAARAAVPFLKWWDVRTARQVDVLIANSSAVASRIASCYGRNAIVVHPAVDVSQADEFSDAPMTSENTCDSGQIGVSESAVTQVAHTANHEPPYYLIVSRLVSYKGLDLAVEVCTVAHRNLVVIGTGPDRGRLESLAGPTVRFLGWQSDETVSQYMAGCQALLFPGEEDFGMTPIEAHTAGRPVVAYRAGGALDTIQPGVNGVFFEERSVQAFIAALEQTEQTEWDSPRIRATAKRFSKERFEAEMRQIVEAAFDSDRTNQANSRLIEALIQHPNALDWAGDEWTDELDTSSVQGGGAE